MVGGLFIGCSEKESTSSQNISYIWTSSVGYLDNDCSNKEFNGFCIEAYQYCMTAINTGSTIEEYECEPWGWSSMTESACDSADYTWYLLNEQINESITITLNNDGTCNVTEADECKNADHEGYNTQSICESAGYEWNGWTKSGTWTESSNIVILTLNYYGSNAYDETMEFTRAGNSLIMEFKETDNLCYKFTYIPN